MTDGALEFFKNILETPSPSGYEQPVQAVVREYVRGFSEEVTTDAHGNLIAVKKSGCRVTSDVCRTLRSDWVNCVVYRRPRFFSTPSRLVVGIRNNWSASD